MNMSHLLREGADRFGACNQCSALGEQCCYAIIHKRGMAEGHRG